MSLEDRVRQFVSLALENPSADDDELVARLVTLGVDEETAECLLAFVPMACARAILSGQGMKLPEDFEIHDLESGRKARGPLRNEPVYVAAESYAVRALSQKGEEAKAVATIAGSSAEMNVFFQLHDRGEDVRNIVLTETVLLRLPVEHLEKRRNEPRPWWRFWK